MSEKRSASDAGGDPALKKAKSAGEAEALVFTVSPKSHPNVKRAIHAGVGVSLQALCNALLESFGWEERAPSAFFMTGMPFKDGVFSELSNKKPAMPRTAIKSQNLRPGSQFIYMYDLGEEIIFNITVSASPSGTAADAPRVVSSQGDPPPQGNQDDGSESFESEDDEEEEGNEEADTSSSEGSSSSSAAKGKSSGMKPSSGRKPPAPAEDEESESEEEEEEEEEDDEAGGNQQAAPAGGAAEEEEEEEEESDE
jgi:hypothetical protein